MAAALVVCACGRLSGIDEYRVGDAPAEGTPAPAACEDPNAVRNSDGVCEPAGVARCPAGFAPDAQAGCSYELSCGQGLDATDELQLPSSCYRFGCGDLAVNPGTWVVDSTRASGAPAAGTADDPFATVGAAVEVAAPGDTVYVRDGRYVENVIIDKPIRVVGRCPTWGNGAVAVRGALDTEPVFSIVTGSDPWQSTAIISGLRIEGGSAGIRAEGGRIERLSNLWIAETGGPGIEIRSHTEPIVVDKVAIVGALGAGLLVVGFAAPRSDSAPEVLIDGVLVRGTRDAAELGGHALLLTSAGAGDTTEVCPADEPALVVQVQNAILEQTAGSAVFSQGMALSLTDTLLVTAESATGAHASVVARSDESGRRGKLSMERVVVDGARGGGIDLFDLERATIVDTVVRGVQPRVADDCRGFGIRAESLPAAPEKPGWICQPVPAVAAMQLSISNTLVDSVSYAGLMVIEAATSVDHSIVRGVKREPCSSKFGDGVAVYSQVAEPPAGSVASCRIEGSARAGLSGFGAKATLSDSELSCNRAGDVLDVRSELVTSESACGCGASKRRLCVAQSVPLEPALAGWQ